MSTYTVVDNIYQGVGFYFIIKDILPSDMWKWGIHETFYDEAEARKEAARLNKERDK